MNGHPTIILAERQQFALALSSVALSGLAYWAGASADSLWPAAWFAPAPLFLARFQSRWWVGALCALVAYCIGRLDLLQPMFDELSGTSRHGYGGSDSDGYSGWVWSAILLAVYSLSTLMARYAARSFADWLAMLLFCGAWAVCIDAASLRIDLGPATSIAAPKTKLPRPIAGCERCIDEPFDTVQLPFIGKRNELANEIFCQLRISRQQCAIIERSHRAMPQRR